MGSACTGFKNVYVNKTSVRLAQSSILQTAQPDGSNKQDVRRKPTF